MLYGWDLQKQCIEPSV